MKNREIADLFEAMADMLAVKGESVHRINAYRRAAENLASLGRPIEEVSQAGELEAIPGVGRTLAAKIDEFLRTGRLEAHEALTAEVPAGVLEMMRVPGVGPKRAALFWKELGLTSVADLAAAARDGQLRQLPGMGRKSEQNVLAGVEELQRQPDRALLGDVLPLAQELLDALRDVDSVVQVAPAGSLRRFRETIGDLDLLAAATDPDAVMDRFRALPQVSDVILSGSTKTSIHTHAGFQVDLRVLEPARWGTALQYFTGSQAHNVHLRELARAQGLSLSEYALTDADGAEILCADEAQVYDRLGLPFIPPELREDRGEIEAARQGALPQLVRRQDLRGDLHTHTDWSDGRQTLDELARAVQRAGFQYVVVADHSQSLGVVGGLSVDDVRRQREAIAALNERLGGAPRVLAGIEVEILSDGRLDFPDDVLADLDLVVASLHSGLRQSRDQATARVLAAIANPHVDVIAHPTGRLLGQRDGAHLDMEAIFQAAAEHGTALEVNAYPQRLDLRDVHVRRALELGVTLAIDSDAHDAEGFEALTFGVGTARRGWARAQDVLNTRSLDDLLAWTRRRASA